MSTNNYIVTSNGGFISEAELYHHGVKGMRWGHRKARRVERKLRRAGKKLGAAEYERDKGNEAYKKHEANAKVFDKAAKKYESEGKYFRAEASRKSAAALRARGANVKAQRDEAAAYLERRGNKLKEKASTYATKKRVDLGTKKVNSILNSAKQKGYESRKSSEEVYNEQSLRDKVGDKNYSTLNKIRGKS